MRRNQISCELHLRVGLTKRFNCLAPYLSTVLQPLSHSHSALYIGEEKLQDYYYVPPKFPWAGKRTTDWRRGLLTLNQLPGSSILCTVSEPFTYVIRFEVTYPAGCSLRLILS
jgi:hypothetical protein